VVFHACRLNSQLFERMPNLRDVELTALTKDRQIPILTELTQAPLIRLTLKTLSLDKQKIELLTRFKQLKSLHIVGCDEYAPDDVRLLAEIPELEELTLGGHYLTPAHILALKDCRGLRQFNICSPPKDSEIELTRAARELKQLDTLAFDVCKMSPSVIEELRNTSNLHTLILNQSTGLDNPTLQAISNLPWLKSLEIANSQVSNIRDWEALAKRSDLEHLTVQNVGQVPPSIATMVRKSAKVKQVE
ncbi:MAG: hypothetical protein K2Z81_28900, partial [Cyanobacteria bacterium]|nr:hypothetical protein [Cyanobacteriota bacterium]